jgi:hypothetical protein
MTPQRPLNGQPQAEPTPKLVREFWDHMADLYGSRVVRKEKAIEMRAAALVLSRMGILDREAFLRKFTTVIGKTVYTPFEAGVESQSYPLWSQITVCVHEHQHIEQLLREGRVQFSVKYLASSAARAAYEAEAQRCDLETHFWRYGTIRNPRPMAEKLRHYGCSAEDVAMAEKMLRMSIDVIERGGLTNRASQKAIAWLDEHAPELKVAS